MSIKVSHIAFATVLAAIVLSLPTSVLSQSEPIPADPAQVNAWFQRNVGGIATRKEALLPDVTAAEGAAKVINVKADGSGEFKTIMDAVNSVPANNKNRVVIAIGPGNYTEKVKIDRTKPFITFRGDPNNVPVLVFGGTAKQFGTMDSATFIVEANFFTAINLKVVNSAPRPDGKMVGAQAVAMRIGGDNAAFYNCQFHGFQDTLCDDKGKHFYKDCYVEGTVDFIFGLGQSIYLNTEIHVIPGDGMAMIAAHSREKAEDQSGYVFVHCKVTGDGNHAFLARSWFAYGRVIYAYCELGNAIHPEGWSNNGHQEHNNTVFFGEFNNKGPGAAADKRAAFGKPLAEGDAQKFLTLDYIEGSKWLLPPTN